MINNLESFLKEANALLSALSEYSSATDKLYKVDFQQEDLASVINDIESIVGQREGIKERAQTAQMAMLNAIEEQSEEDGRLIKCVFRGEEVAFSLSGHQKLAKEAIFKLLGIQKDIIEKDGVVLDRLSNKRGEVKTALKDLQGDKKKLDFLNLTAPGTPDSGFNV